MTAEQSISAARSRYLFLTIGEWVIGFAIAAAASAGVFSTAREISGWIPVTIFIMSITAYHMTRVARWIIVLPHISILVAGLQYVLAAWLSIYFPAENSEYDMGQVLPYYLSYAGPVLVAIVVGWTLCLIKFPIPKRALPDAAPELLAELDILLLVGFLAAGVSTVVQAPALAFFFLLLSNLRYLSIYWRMLARGSGWHWRVALVLGVEVLTAAGSAMFHTLLIWTFWTFAVWAYCFRPRRATVAVALAVVCFLLPAIQESKWRLRNGPLVSNPVTAVEEADSPVSSLSQARVWLSYLASSLTHSLMLNLDPQFISDAAVRFNQGWIITRVITYVPDATPFAQGDTIKDALVAALVPRIIFPEKVFAGGREKMRQYTGIELSEGTSMNLGLAGEMYANFGYIGGILACGAYVFAFGLLFRWFCSRAARQPLWWGIVPYVFYSIIKAEDDVAFGINWAVKAIIVFGVILVLLPGVRRQLFTRDSALNEQFAART